MQDCDYRIGWSGPVSSDDDSNTVIVPDLSSDLLTEHQRIFLTEELHQHTDTKYCVEHSIVARAFTSSCHSPSQTVTYVFSHFLKVDSLPKKQIEYKIKY